MKRNPSVRYHRSIVLQLGIAAAATIVWAHTGHAATQTWKAAVDGNWGDANWTNIVPPATDSAQFNATGVNGNETIYLNGNQGAASLIFSNTGTTTLLGGASGSAANNVLALTNSITVSAGAGAVTIGDSTAKVDLTTSSSQTYANNTNNVLTFANGITSSAASGTQTITIGNSNGIGTGGVVVGGPIANGATGAMALTINAPKTTTTLLGTNSYTGGTKITQGKLTYGSSTSPSIIQTMGAISCDAGVDAILTSVLGNSGNTSLTFGTPAYTAGGTLNYVVSGGTNGVDNQIATTGGAGFVSKQAFFNGADYAYRNGVNTYMRAPVYGTDAGFGTAGVALVSAAHNLITSSITGQGGISVNTLKFSGAGAVDLTQTAATIITFNTNSGILRSGGGTTTISGGTITTGSGIAYVVRADTSSDSVTINSKLSNSGTNTFTKSGDGTVTLGGANTFTGTTYGSGGTLNITGSSATSLYQATGSGVINLNSANAATGTTAITAQNCGTVNINASQNTTGVVTVDSNGTLGIGDDNALTGTSITFKSGNLQATGGARSIAAAINFQNANNYTINGSDNLTLTGPVSWLGSQSLTVNNAGTTTFGGTFTMRLLTDSSAQRTFTLMGSGTTKFTGPIVNGGSLNGIVDFSGTGTVELNGDNSYSGSTTIRAGQTVKLGHINGLGFGGFTAVNGGTTVSSGGTLDLNGKGPVNETMTINGSGVGGTGALINSDTGNTAVIGNGVSQITPVAAGSYATAPAVTVNNGGGATAAASLGLIPASINVDTSTGTYSSAPTLTITGGGGSGATATVSIAGVVSIGNTGFGYTSAPTITVTNGTLASGTPWTATSSGLFGATAIQMTNAGTGTTGPVSVSFDSGAATATANVSSVALGSASSIGGAGDITINCAVTGGNSLTKTGAGTLTLAGTCTYSGSSTIDSGSLVIGNGGTTGRLTATNGITNNGSMTINRSDSFSQAGDLGLSAAITGTGSFTQAGAGTTTLTAANDYAGTTTVSNGKLFVDGDQYSATGEVTVANGATLGGVGSVGGDVTIADGGKLEFNLSTDASGHNPLDAIGALAFSGGSTLTITSTSGAAVGVYTLATSSGITGTLPATVILPQDWVATLQLSEDGNNLELDVTEVGVAQTPYEQWATSPPNNLAGDNALATSDPDHDGVSNLIEFGLNGNPNSGASTGLLFAKMATVSSVPNVLTLTIAVRDSAIFSANGNRQTAAADGITYTIEASNDLGDWGGPVVTEVTGDDALTIQGELDTPEPGWSYRTFQTDGSSASDAADFIRVGVE